MTITWLIPGTGLVPDVPDAPDTIDAPLDGDDATLAVDHVEAALARLPDQYRHRCDGELGESNTQQLIRVLMSPAADLENALLAVLGGRDVDTAVGFMLDLLGTLVGRPRNGVTDDEIYRRYVKAQISANKSDGIIGDILTVARLVLGDDGSTFTLRNEGAAAYVVEVSGVASDPAVITVLVQLIILATSAGVRAIIEYSTDPPEDVLRWDTQGEWDTGLWASGTDEEL